MTVKKIFALLVFLAALGIGLFLTSKPATRPNVIVLLLDTLRADHLSLNGYERETTPVIDKFARENLYFSRTISAAPWTPPSVASILTGLYPTAHGMMPPNSRDEARQRSTTLANKLTTLAEVFKENGYNTAAVTPNPWMKEEFNFQQGFDRYEYRHRVRAAEINSVGYEMLKDLQAESKPFFLYLHYLDPHNPFNPPGKFHDMFQGPLKARDYPEKQVKYVGLYDGEIRYLDSELGKLFDFLKTEDLYEDTIIVLVSDHGEQFMERGHQGHGFQLFNEEILVPLALKAGAHAGQIDSTVSTIDIFPTLLELTGIETTLPLQGISLLQTDKLAERSGVLSEIKRIYDLKSFTGSGLKKLIVDLGKGTSEIFEILKDRNETAPISEPALIEPLKKDFKAALEDSLKLRKNIDIKEVDTN